MIPGPPFFFFFFFNDTATTEIYTLSLHDALPIFAGCTRTVIGGYKDSPDMRYRVYAKIYGAYGRSFLDNTLRSEEHTSELQSLRHLVCRLLLEKKKKKNTNGITSTYKCK